MVQRERLAHALIEPGFAPDAMRRDERVVEQNYNAQGRCFIITEHKTQKNIPKRIVPLSPKMIEMAEWLVVAHPEGALFRNRVNKPWTADAWMTHAAVR